MTPEERSAKIDAQIAQNAADIRRLIVDSRSLLRRTERLAKSVKIRQHNFPGLQKEVTKEIKELRRAQAASGNASRKKLRKLVESVDRFLRRRRKKRTKE